MESLCSGTSHTISDTVSTTTTDGTSQSSSVTDGTQKTKGVSGGINGGVGSSSGTSVTKVSPVAGGIAGILGLGGAVASVAIPVAGAVIGPLLGTAGRAIGGMAPSRTAFNSIARNIGGSMGVNDSWGTSHSATEQTGTSHSTSDGTSHGAVFCAVASVGFVLPASAEETMTHDLDEVIVEEDRDALPGGFVANNDRVGILGNIKAIDVPFTQKKYTEKTIMTFYDPNQPLNGVLANSPSIRVGSPSPMYTDFSMRGVNMNASHYYINGIPNMFNQTRSIPTYVLSSVDIVSGPNTVLNGATFSNNGTNGTDAPAGLLNGTTKRATTDPVTRYTQRFSGRSTWTEDLDIGRRFGKNNEWGIRVNAHNEDGGLSMEGADVRDKSIYINLDQIGRASGRERV